jgi:hypothetical protein
MEKLLTNSLKLYYYVVNDTIFNISNANINQDPCAKLCGNGGTVKDESESTKLPYIIYTDTTGGESTDVGYWLQSLIDDGDEYKDDKFKKLNHELITTTTPEGGTPTSTETKQTYIEYFKFLCEKEIKSVLLANPSTKIDTTVPDSLISQMKGAIPGWMVKSNGYTLKSTNEDLTAEQLEKIQIDVKDATYIKGLLSTAIKELAISSANNALRPYGKKLGSCVDDACIVDIN